MEEKIVARAIIEILGAPKEHVQKAMKVVLENLVSSQAIKILNKNTSKVKKLDKLYSTFSELELEFTNINILILFCYNYMPSSIEILKPNKIVFDSIKMTDFFNDLIAQLHKIDMVVKKMNLENKLLRKELEKLKS